MTAAAIDANCISEFQKERILNQDGIFQAAVETIINNHYIILDESGHCQQEWLDTALGPANLNLKDWIADLIIRGVLRFIRMGAIGNHRRSLAALGLPAKDMKWFALCRDGDAAIFLTEDIDFFDPKSKMANSTRKTRIKTTGPAPVKRYFRDSIGTDVVCCHHLCE